MIYTITLNPLIDYNITVDDFSCGKVNRCKTESVVPGGKGINVSMVLKNLGFETTALGFVAGFTGEYISKVLEEKGINTDFIKLEEGYSRINVNNFSE